MANPIAAPVTIANSVLRENLNRRRGLSIGAFIGGMRLNSELSQGQPRQPTDSNRDQEQYIVIWREAAAHNPTRD